MALLVAHSFIKIVLLQLQVNHLIFASSNGKTEKCGS